MGIGFTTFLCFIVGFLPYTSGANFSVYWNVFTWHCKDNISSVLDNYGIQRNTNDSYIGDKVALFYEYTFGLYPYFKNYNLSIPINKGTPQNVSGQDIDRHINISLYNISAKITNESSSGLGIVDFEEWRPLYAINSVKKEVYKVAAIQITNQTRGGISNETELNITAQKDYDEAAKVFLLATLNNATNRRPKTLWGMYGFPYCNYDAGNPPKNHKGDLKNLTLDAYRCRKNYQDFNDRMEYIFNASQALYPSIYLNNKTDAERNFRYVEVEELDLFSCEAIMTETLRISRNYNPPKPIYVYTKFEYEPRQNICSFYTREDLCSTVVLPYALGANGLIFWSSSNNMTERCDIVTNYVNTTLGPLVQKVLDHNRNNSTLPPYNITSTMWNLNDICKEYIPLIANFTDPGCPNATSTTTTTA